MVEENSHLHEFDDADGLTPQQLAGMRWQAIEAFNGIVGLSPMARRLGIKLISCMDAKTRRCYPGEARIAAELGVHLSAVKKAKAELKDAGLISWFNPGGPRHLSHYSFNWAALLRYSIEAKQRGDEEVSKSIIQRRKGTRRGTIEPHPNSTPQGTNATSRQRHVERSHSTRNEFHSTQIGSQGTLQGTPIVPVGVPDTTQDITLKDITHLNTPSEADAGPRRDEVFGSPFEDIDAPQQTEPRRALERVKPQPPKFHCFFPALVEVLAKDNPKLMVAISKLNFEQQREASKLLATKGSLEALTHIEEQSSRGAAA